MESVYDVQQLLKKFGSFIYTGDRIGDLELMHDEMKELFEQGLIQTKDFQLATLILKKEIRKIKQRKGTDGKNDFGN